MEDVLTKPDMAGAPKPSPALTTRPRRDDSLAELTAEHRRLDQRLQQLEKRRALTPSEQHEISQLKKQKLLTKERIARLS